MTSDHHPPELPDDSELERAIRDLLRNDPVELDVERRERAITAAITAADEVEGLAPPAAPVVRELSSHRAGRRTGRGDALRPILVAAATLAVVAGGVFAISELGSGSVDENMAAQGAAVDEGSTSADDGSAGEETPSDTAPDTAPDEAPEAGSAERGPVSSTTQPPPAIALGEHPDVESLLDAAQRTTGFDSNGRDAGAVAAEPAPTEQAVAATCATELDDRDATAIATATVAGAPVVVAVLPDGTTVVLRVGDCAELGRR